MRECPILNEKAGVIIPLQGANACLFIKKQYYRKPPLQGICGPLCAIS